MHDRARQGKIIQTMSITNNGRHNKSSQGKTKTSQGTAVEPMSVKSRHLNQNKNNQSLINLKSSQRQLSQRQQKLSQRQLKSGQRQRTADKGKGSQHHQQ
ncbi:unnamed protein product [Ambrosiozyma monospora]|uniref:Unnamed protein product n=1 Tax=Ambrosiozyma monospora TaxID=43982 RepID=A0A9W6YSS2_AMBMO|nr:unnamed protein product [Ambrosiozyma monospora]